MPASYVIVFIAEERKQKLFMIYFLVQLPHTKALNWIKLLDMNEFHDNNELIITLTLTF